MAAGTDLMASFEDALRSLVADALEEYLGKFAKRLGDPEPLVYSIPQAAKVLSTSADTIRRLVAEGHLTLVPHMGERRLIPRSSVEALVNQALTSPPTSRRLGAVS